MIIVHFDAAFNSTTPAAERYLDSSNAAPYSPRLRFNVKESHPCQVCSMEGLPSSPAQVAASAAA
jgi:hypothetical protein